MIRGLVGVVPSYAAEVGRFYMSVGYGNGPGLFLCVQTDERLDDTFRAKALYFSKGEVADLRLSDIPQEHLVALDDVHVRIDPTSLSGGAFNSRVQPGTFFLDGMTAHVCVPLAYRGWVTVNISEGRTVGNDIGHSWLAFNRWSLVMDDEHGEELTVASFGDPEPAITTPTP